MLSSIVTGKIFSPFVLVQDSVQQSGDSLLTAFIQNMDSTSEKAVHVLCCEQSVTVTKNKLQHCRTPQLSYCDCFSDPLRWISCADINIDCIKKQSGGLNLLEIVSDMKRTNGVEYMVVIDSLSSVILNIGVAQCFKQLHALVTQSRNTLGVSQLVCLVHADLLPHANETLEQLRHLATTCVEVLPPSSSSDGVTVADIIHKKSGGKVIREMEIFSIDPSGCVTSKQMSAEPTMKPAPCGDSEVLPHDLTTFKLGLGDSEKEARSKLVLPYLRPQKEGVGEAQGEGGGRVIYQPDAADDWDEDDPDDDLDV